MRYRDTKVHGFEDTCSQCYMVLGILSKIISGIRDTGARDSSLVRVKVYILGIDILAQ